MKIKLFLLFIIPAAFQANLLIGQTKLVFPEMNDTLNQCQIMFEFEQVHLADFYQVEIAKSKTNFDKNLIIKQKTFGLASRVDSLLDFDHQYFWRVKSYNKNAKIISTSEISSFYIKGNNWSNALLIKNEIKKYDPKKSSQSFIVFDFGVITDRKGKIVWFLPKNEGPFRNIVLNKDGAVTYNGVKGAYEVNLKGEKIWEAPFILADSTIIKNYHHDLKKLKNGNFLCLAEVVLPYETNQLHSAIFELDRKNSIKWIFKEEPIYRKRIDNIVSNHINAIDFDEKRGVVYTSNRNLNNLSKIKTGDTCIILKNIGFQDNPVFSGQHSVSILPSKNLLLFNNNSQEKSERKGNSSVLEIDQANSKDSVIKVVWEYKFSFAESEENMCAKAGDADLLPNGNILICSGANNRVFEINRQKEIVWECLSFKRDKPIDSWTPQSSYRAHYCSSLYPTYFTLQFQRTNALNLSKNQKLAFYLNNHGSENDEYEITIQKRDEILKNYSISLSAYQRKLEEINLLIDQSGDITVKVASKNNPEKIKTLNYLIK